MKTTATALSVALILVAGCHDHDDNAGPVVVAPSSVVVVDNADAIVWETSFFWTASAAIDPTTAVDVNAIAASYAKTVASTFEPFGCATASLSATNVVELRLDNCSGPFGVRGAVGTVVIALGVDQSAVGLTVIANGLAVAGGVLMINASAVLTGIGNTRTLAIQTNSGGVEPNGDSLARLGRYTVGWTSGDTCVTIDGML
ncbi:MAG TPA: hypothetical protein VGH63_11770, partial [Polyangia bacterium]